MESGFLLEQFSRVCISPFLYFFLSFVALIRYFLLLLDDKARAGMHRD